MMLSKKAWSNEHGQDSSYFLGWEEYQKNPNHATTNANGIIQMGLAENQLSFDFLETWLQNNPDASGFKNNGRFTFRDLALFQDYHGLPAFKNAMVKLMSRIRGNKLTFNPNNLVLTFNPNNHVVAERLAHRRRARSRWLPRLGYANRESDIHGSIVGFIEA